MQNQDSKVVRFEIETDDGPIHILTGKEAEEHDKYLKKCISISRGFGVPLSKAKWNKTNKYPA